MYQTSDIKNGLKFEMDNAPWAVVWFQFVKPGKGTAFTRTKMKNLLTGSVIERNFRTGETFVPADVQEHEMQYLFNDGEFYQFMNTESYDQVAISAKVLGEASQWLVDQMMVQVLFYKGNPVKSISWMKNGEDIGHNDPVLRINSVKKEDRGMYQCFVRNDQV